MNEEMRKKLVEMLEVKTRQSQEASRQRQQARIDLNAFHSRVADVLDEIVVPVLEEFAKQLNAWGRQSRVLVNHEEGHPPYLTLYVQNEGIPFDIQVADHVRISPSAEIDKILVDERILDLHGSAPSKSQARHFPLAEITREKVEQMVFEFVQRLIGA